MKKILLFLTKGFELIEMSAFVDVFGWNKTFNKIDINVITCGFNKEIKSTFNVTITVDKVFHEINPDDYDAMAIPGGFGYFGFYEEAYDERLLNLIRDFDSKKKPIATVCVSALILGKSGILKGKKATTYHLMDGRRQRQLEEFGAIIEGGSVVKDEHIITSWCPSTAPYVALELLETMTSKEYKDHIKEIMGY